MRIVGSTRGLVLRSLFIVLVLLPDASRAFTPIAGSEDALTQNTAGSQTQPKIASFADGTYVVAWLDQYVGSVYARRFDAAGQPDGPEFVVLDNFYIYGQFAISPRPDKGFIVAATFARIFGPDDVQVGSDIVFQSSPWYQGIGSVAVRDDGRFLIVWTAAVEDPCCAFEYDVHARLYDPLGSALTPEFQVNIFEEDAQSHSVAAAISNGNFVVAWGDRVQGGIFFSLYARMFDGDANALTGEILVDQLGMDLQLPSSIRATPAGGFVIAWESREDGNSYMRQFDADAEPLGDQVKVNGADPDLNVASGSLLSIRSDGTMLAAWAAGGYQQPIGRIMGRMYDASLQPLTEPFQINGFDLDGKGIGGVFLPDTGDIFHVAWEISSPHETDGSGAGVFRAIGCIGDGPDSDGDGTGDSCDPCTAGYTFDRADRSRFRFIGDLFGNDRYAFSGEFIIGSIAEWTAIDPEVLLRIRVEGDRRRALIDADLSGSNLWSVNGSSMKWTYRDTSAAIDGITKVKMQFVNGDDPRIRIKVAGKNAHYGIAADEAQQAVSVTYGNAVDGECAQVGFLASECRFDGLGRAFSCSQ